MISDQQYLSIFRALPSPSLIIRPETSGFTIVAANAAYLGLSQLEEGTLLGQPVLATHGPAWGHDGGTSDLTLLASLRQVLLTGRSHTYFLRGTLESPEQQVVHSPVLGDNGEVLWIIHTLDGCPAQATRSYPSLSAKKSQKELMDYKYALDQANMVSVSDPAGTIIFANDLFCRFSGYTQEELIGKSHNIMNSGYHPPSFFAQIWTTISAGQVWKGEIQNKTKRGSHYWAQMTIVPFLDEAGTPYQFMAFRTDITEKKESELKLEESEKKYRDLFQLSPQPMWVYEVENLRFMDVNEAAVRHYGYTRDEFLAMTIRDIRPSEEVPQLEDAVARVRQHTTLFTSGTYRHQKKNGDVIHVEILSNIIYSFGTKCELILAHDITGRLQATQQLEEAYARLETAQELARLGYWEYELKTGAIYWSEEMYAIWELPPQGGPLSPEAFLETIHPEDRPFIRVNNLHELSRFPSQSMVFRIVTPNQTLKYIHQRVNLINEGTGTPAKLNGTIQDITQQKIDETTLRNKTRLLEAISRFNSVLLQSEDWECVLVEAFEIVGQAVESDRVYYFEYRADASSGPEFPEKRIDWTQPDIKTNLRDSDLQKNPVQLFKLYLEPLWEQRNEPFWALVDDLPQNQLKDLLTEQGILSFLIVPLYIRGTFHGFIGFDDFRSQRQWSDDEQSFIQTIASNLAMTVEEQKTKESLKESEQRLASLISNLPGITYRCLPDETWTMQFISDEVERMTGYPASDFINNQRRSFSSIIHPDDLALTYDLYVPLKARQVFQLNYRLQAADGSIIWAEEKGMGIYDEQGELLWIDGVIMDVTEKKKTDQTFKAVFEHTQDAILLANDQAQLLDFNRVATTLLGYTPDELRQLRVDQLFKIADPTAPFLEVWQAFLKEGIQQGVTQLFRKDGSVITGAFNAQPHILPGLHLTVVTDITEKVKQEQALLASEKRFKALVQEGSDLISILDTSGNYLFVSETTIPYLGMRPEDLVGKNAFEFIHPDDQEQVLRQFQALEHVRQTQISPFRFRDAANQWHWITTLATNLLDEPAVGGIVANSRDITEAVQQAQQLQLSNERYKLVLKASNEAISDWDIEANHVEWGPGFHDLFGYDLAIHNNRLWSDNIHPEDKDRVLQELRQALQDPAQELFHSEYRFMKANRESAIIQHRAIFLRNEQGKAIRSLASFRDITKVQESAYKIQLQNDKLREIAWIQSHVIRAPVARIMALVEVLKDKDSNPWSQQEVLDHLCNSIHELDEIIHDIVEKSAQLK
ncbi:hypothetical protein GCM10027275_11230 [Rhabdobacter roseus]|uniref:histidine kinase n=1 Tax=Rhabdobacter roseus TaxID=1655419 RepID=A0A840TP84_9BACT|nr:PAS domain S-box protein [Rhabdobacter roseus]MBB5283033.1 PAS domain S-box-containing protein [Rhabdobacter roseus]